MRLMLLLSVWWICLGSCSKFLAKKSNNTLVTPSTTEDLQQILDDSQLMNEVATPSYGETSSDDYFIPNKIYSGMNQGYQNLYTWAHNDASTSNDWSTCYVKIYNANLCLEKLSEIKPNNNQLLAWKNVKGSALFFRAYYFLELAWNYAKAYDKATSEKDLGIALRTSSDFNVPSKRANVEQTYQKIIEDSKQSLKLLPNYATVPTRPSKAAAYGLLARTYLSMRDYNNALKYADSCLKLNDQLIDFNGDNDIINDLSKNVPFKKFNKEIIFYTEMNKVLTLYKTTTRGRVDSSLYLSYNPHDIRTQAYFTQNKDGYQMFKANYTANMNLLFTGIATDEIYLIRSESYIHMGELQKGIDDLNSLLIKRWDSMYFKPFAGISKKEALIKVLTERRKELLMRGLRWMDIKRQNKETANIVLKRLENGIIFKLEPNSKFYALPLPDDIIQLTNMPQNPL